MLVDGKYTARGEYVETGGFFMMRALLQSRSTCVHLLSWFSCGDKLSAPTVPKFLCGVGDRCPTVALVPQELIGSSRQHSLLRGWNPRTAVGLGVLHLVQVFFFRVA